MENKANRLKAGSSPRMRGTHERRGRAAAYQVDHPRACGEHWWGAAVDVVDEGSSPRMRGTLPLAHQLPVHVGIIPAHAGNTGWRRLAPNRPWDHPRACGEHDFQKIRVRVPLGSSPRMRGTRCSFLCPFMMQGIIPAHAGNTDIIHIANFRDKDHPRACGEHELSMPRKLTSSGSSPRMRGTQ